jgi:hypothetical protein
VQRALHDCFVTRAARAALKAAALRTPGDRVLDCRVLVAKGEFPRELREGRDVFACGLSFEVLVQGDESAS